MAYLQENKCICGRKSQKEKKRERKENLFKE